LKFKFKYYLREIANRQTDKQTDKRRVTILSSAQIIAFEFSTFCVCPKSINIAKSSKTWQFFYMAIHVYDSEWVEQSIWGG